LRREGSSPIPFSSLDKVWTPRVEGCFCRSAANRLRHLPIPLGYPYAVNKRGRMSTIRLNVVFGCQLSTISLLAVLAWAPAAVAQSTPQTQPQQQPSQQPTQPPPDQASPDAGGPGGDNGAIALPKKKEKPDDAPPPAPAQPKFKNPEGAGDYTLRVDVPEVSVDVGVLLEKSSFPASNHRTSRSMRTGSSRRSRASNESKRRSPRCFCASSPRPLTITTITSFRICGTPHGNLHGNCGRRTTSRL